MFVKQISKLSVSRLFTISITASIIMSLAITSIMSLFFYGSVTFELIITGFVVSAIVATIIIHIILGLTQEIKASEMALEKSHKKISSWLECSPVCTKVLDADFKMIYMSSAGVQCLQIEDITEYYGKKFPFDWYPEPSKNNIIKSLEKTRDTGEVVNIDMSVHDMSGNEWWFNSTFIAVNNEMGKLDHIMVVSFNITDKIKMENRLRQIHKMEAIGTMAGGIAHDFNNILAAIIGFSELAKDDMPDNSPASYQIEQVLKAGFRAKELVGHILAFSRMPENNNCYTSINMSQVVKETLSFQRSIIPTTIEIISDIDEACGWIRGDSTQIHQTVMNFCTNAVHAMEGKRGTLGVSLHKVELSLDDLEKEPNMQPGLYVKLSVSDTGIGLTPELIDKIFDPYFTTKDVGKGSGLGLSVIHGIVNNHGGFVKVESKPGKGSTFNTFFPLVEEDNISQYDDELEVLPTGTERILFVDDEKMLVDLGKSMLEKLGYSVTALTDSADALILFKDDPSQFDLVITDQTMPNISGAELSKQLVQIKPDIPIILCTGYSSMIDEVKAQKIGIKKYVMKPADHKVIAKLIRELLDGDESTN